MLPSFLDYIRCGSSGDYVRVIQKVLNHYPTIIKSPLTPDGIFGPKTQAAVKCFQGRYGLVCDGVVGPLTRAKIFPLGTHQTVCYVTKSYDEIVSGSGPELNFALSGSVLGQVAGAAPAPVLASPSATAFPLAAMPPDGSLMTDDIPGFPEPFPFPELLPKLPSLRLPDLPLIPPLTLPSFFPKKLQLVGSAQVTVPKLTLVGPPPKSNPTVFSFPFTIRGAWPAGAGGSFQAGGTVGIPFSQPISDPKNTTFQVFAQGVSPDLLVKYKSWYHLYVLGKASVTWPKDQSSTSFGLSPQFKAGFDLTKDGSVSFSVVGGPVLSGAVSGGKFSLSLTPFSGTVGVTVSTP